jgi:hypothetical protein
MIIYLYKYTFSTAGQQSTYPPQQTNTGVTNPHLVAETAAGRADAGHLSRDQFTHSYSCERVRPGSRSDDRSSERAGRVQGVWVG